MLDNKQSTSVKEDESIKWVSACINLYHYLGVATPVYFAYVCLLFIGRIWLQKVFLNCLNFELKSFMPICA